MQNRSCENEFYFHDNKKIIFTRKVFALSLVLKQRHAASRKWPTDRIINKGRKNEPCQNYANFSHNHMNRCLLFSVNILSITHLSAQK